MTSILKTRPDTGTLILAAVLVIAACTPLLGEAYLTRLATTFLIYAIVALSLDFLVGYGGMVSFGHAAFFGLGTYAAAFLGLNGINDLTMVLALSFLIAATGALVIGAFSLRTRGAYFIMITLAFAQMLYYASVAVTKFGGDDGIRVPRNHLFGFALSTPASFFYVVFGVFLLIFVLLHRVVLSRFGRTILAIKDNEGRVASAGYNPFVYQLTAFCLAGGIAGMAGALQANLNEYASSDTFHWVLSGDFLVMIILGGVGTLAGPVLGTALFLLLQNIISAYTPFWMIVMAPLILAIVLSSSGGIYALLARLPRGARA